MKNILILLLAIGIFSCRDKSAKNTEQSTVDSTIIKATDSITHKRDTLNAAWIDSFRNFRNAIYRDDLNKIKLYFSFPVLNINNEIWSVVLAGSNDIFSIARSDTLIPFTEKDFMRYYKKLFPKEFRTGLLKIKSDELFKLNKTYTESIDLDSVTTYSISASVNKEDNTLNLAILYNTVIKDENGDVEDGGEGSTHYTFIIQSDGHLLFKQIQTAG